MLAVLALFFTSVMMYNPVVCVWEQLIELSKAQVVPGIRPKIQTSLRGDVWEHNGEKGGGCFNHLFP